MGWGTGVEMTEHEKTIWQSGFDSGVSDIGADWDVAFDGLLPDELDVGPTVVAGYVRVLDLEVALLRRAVRSLFESAAQSGQKTIMVVGTEEEIAAVQGAVQRALAEHPEDPTFGAPEAHRVHVEDGGSVMVHPAWCHAKPRPEPCTDYRDRFTEWAQSTGRNRTLADGDYLIVIDDEGLTCVRRLDATVE